MKCKKKEVCPHDNEICDICYAKNEDDKKVICHIHELRAKHIELQERCNNLLQMKLFIDEEYKKARQEEYKLRQIISEGIKKMPNPVIEIKTWKRNK